MGGAVSGRVGLAALVLALVANIPVIAAAIIFAILVSGTRGSVVEALGELLAVVGPIVPAVLGGISVLALVLGIVAVARGQRDGITAIVICAAAPLVAFAIVAAPVFL